MYAIWLYPVQDWWKTVKETLDFMYTGQMGNSVLCPATQMIIQCMAQNQSLIASCLLIIAQSKLAQKVSKSIKVLWNM